MEEKDRLRSHSFDGIEEYDNQLPRWWVGTFILTVLFGISYWSYYEIFQVGQTQVESYEREMALLPKASSEISTISEDELRLLIGDKVGVEKSGALYRQHCAACHGVYGEGIIGPNLTDSYWIHGGSASTIVSVISEGVPEKGMLSWKSTLTTDQMRGLTAYIISLHGSNPANAKAPEGELVE